MTTKRFKATILSGHKENAVEVPFDPSVAWNLPSTPIKPGRRGFAISAKIGDVAFDSFVVARSKRFWLLLPSAVEKAAGIGEGDEVGVAIAPRKHASA